MRCSTTISTYLAAYMSLFVGRKDDYARQVPDGRYRRVGRPLEPSDVHDHLMGIRSYGTYVTDERGLCRFAVLDADTEQGLHDLWNLCERFMLQNVYCYLESSRRGGHLWMFFTEPVLASRVRGWLLPFVPAGIECYPKQDEGKGYGSLIRLPLGVHQRSGQRYAFMQRGPSGPVSVAPTLEEMLTWLSTIQRVQVPPVARGGGASVPVQPTHPNGTARPSHTSFSPSSPARSHGSPATIRDWCAQYDPFDFIGCYVDLDRAGVGRCPFSWHHVSGRDEHASFKVYRPGVPGGYCWYCYAWQQGGSLFDFLRYYQQVDVRTLWRQIQQGAQS